MSIIQQVFSYRFIHKPCKKMEKHIVFCTSHFNTDIRFSTLENIQNTNPILNALRESNAAY